MARRRIHLRRCQLEIMRYMVAGTGGEEEAGRALAGRVSTGEYCR